MSTEPPALAYAPPTDSLVRAAWGGLRVATVVWAAAVVVRHATYWSAVAVPAPGEITAQGLALAESALLVAVIVVAIGARTPGRARTLAILGAAAIALAAMALVIDVARLPPRWTGGKVGRTAWMAATRLQNVVIPVAWIVVASAARRRV